MKHRAIGNNINYGFVGYYSLRTDNKGSKLEIAADYFTSLTRSNTDYLFDATAAYQSESQASVVCCSYRS